MQLATTKNIPNLLDKFPLCQNSFFKSYNGNDYNGSENICKEIKQNILNIGLSKKKQIIENSNKVSQQKCRDLLNNLANDIQFLINTGEFFETSKEIFISKIKTSLGANDPEHLKKIIDYVHCCIILAKHYTNEKNITNWFGFANVTSNIDSLIKDKPSDHTTIINNEDEYLERQLHDLEIKLDGYVFINCSLKEVTHNIFEFLNINSRNKQMKSDGLKTLNQLRCVSKNACIAVERYEQELPSIKRILSNYSLTNRYLLNYFAKLCTKHLNLVIKTHGIKLEPNELEGLKSLCSVLSENKAIQEIEITLDFNDEYIEKYIKNILELKLTELIIKHWSIDALNRFTHY